MGRSKVRQVIERVVHDGKVTATADGSEHEIFPVAASVAEGKALHDWVVRERASRTIEIGLGYGVSTLFICDGLLHAGHDAPRHIAIDPFQSRRFSNVGLQLLGEAGVSQMVEHIAEESQFVLPRLCSSGKTFDLAFVDGNHRFDRVFVDLFYLGRLLRPGGVVFMDDYQLPGVARSASFFVSNVGWRVEEVSGDDDLHQWAVLRTSTEADTRPFTYFVDF